MARLKGEEWNGSTERRGMKWLDWKERNPDQLRRPVSADRSLGGGRMLESWVVRLSINRKSIPIYLWISLSEDLGFGEVARTHSKRKDAKLQNYYESVLRIEIGRPASKEKRSMIPWPPPGFLQRKPERNEMARLKGEEWSAAGRRRGYYMLHQPSFIHLPGGVVSKALPTERLRSGSLLLKGAKARSERWDGRRPRVRRINEKFKEEERERKVLVLS